MSVRVLHERGAARLDVETSDERDRHADLDTWHQVGDWTSLVTRPDRVRFPLRLQADRWEQDVPVDGVPVAFVFVGDATSWSALGRTSTRQIAVTGDGWPHDGLALESVDAAAVAQG